VTSNSQQARWKREKRSARAALSVSTKTIFYFYACTSLHSRNENVPKSQLVAIHKFIENSKKP